jgi:hypothetical protein
VCLASFSVLGHGPRSPRARARRWRPAPAAAGLWPWTDSRVRMVPHSGLAWRWPALAGCGLARATACAPRTQGRVESTVVVVWPSWRSLHLSIYRPRRVHGRVPLLPRLVVDPIIVGWDVPLPLWSPLADASVLCLGRAAPFQHGRHCPPISSLVRLC